MSRPLRSERLATKGRPKRRAAKTHFFKYQLANNPSRAEENDLKRALQESLEEQHYTSPSPISPSPKGKSRQYNNGNHLNNNHYSTTSSNINNNSMIISSTNSSDVSRSNNSGSSNESVGYLILNANSSSSMTPKRTRSNTSSLLTFSPASKRAKLNGTNGHHQSKCDADTSASNISLQQSSPIGLSQRAIKTYSRSQPNSIEAHQHKQKNKQNHADNSTISSTPTHQSSASSTIDVQIIKPDFEINSTLNGKQESHKQLRISTNEASISKGTQTLSLGIKSNLQSSASSEVIKINGIAKNLTPCAIKSNQKKNSDTKKEMPNQDTYLKFKRESKNYAYVKMTALKVSTQKSPSSNSKTASINKKSSPNGVSHNHGTNRNSPADKASPRTHVSSNDSNSSVSRHSCNPTEDSANHQASHCSSNNSLGFDNSLGLVRPVSSRSDVGLSQRSSVDLSATTSSSPQKNSPHNSKALDNNRTSKNSKSVQGSKNDIPKHSQAIGDIDTISHGRDIDFSTDDTRDLSKNKNQNQAIDVKVTKKRLPQGSWSLLGVPEEKLIYLKDDEPPKRLICYPAIKHVEGDVIQVRDSVLLRSGARKTDLPYIAKVCAFWEDAETGGVMMSLFWYYRPEHTEEGRKAHHLSDEIFASRHRDVDSVECIDDKCYVLTFNEYCRYRKRCKMEQVNTTWSLTDVTIPLCNESYPRRNRIPDSDVNPELVFCCRQIYDSRTRRLVKNPLINPKYGNI